jgi:effector-binding domain-containing protein
MKLLRIIFYILLSLVALVVTLGLFARHDYHIERSTQIEAPRNIVLDHVRMFKNFSKWSPWNTLDRNMKTSIEGTDGEVGAVYKWVGNDDVGAGQEVIKSVQPDRVDIEVTFLKPWKSVAPSFFKLETIDSMHTKVSWGFDMYIGFPWNAMAMLTDINAAVGKDYERGLGNLKKVCESFMHKKYRGYDVVEVNESPELYAGLRKTVPMDDLNNFFTVSYPKLQDALQHGGLHPGTMKASLTYVWDEQNKIADIMAVFPVKESKKLADSLQVVSLHGGRAIEIEFMGSYDSLGNAHKAMGDYMAFKKLQPIPPVIEQYITDPKTEPDTSRWLTKVIYYVEPIPADTLKAVKEKQ